MTTLTTLIEAYNDAKDDYDHEHGRPKHVVPRYDAAAHALAQFVCEHAADIAERERLERAVVEAWKVSEDKRKAMLADDQDRRKLNAWAEASREYQRQCEKLTAWLVAHAESDGRP